MKDADERPALGKPIAENTESQRLFCQEHNRIITEL